MSRDDGHTFTSARPMKAFRGYAVCEQEDGYADENETPSVPRDVGLQELTQLLISVGYSSGRRIDYRVSLGDSSGFDLRKLFWNSRGGSYLIATPCRLQIPTSATPRWVLAFPTAGAEPLRPARRE